MSYYGNYYSRTFGEIFPDVDAFKDIYNSGVIPARLLTGTEYAKYDISAIYALLCSEYFGAHISMSSEDWFKLKVMQTIFEYGPQWQREMALQDKLLKLTDAELRAGSKAIYNHAAHPSTEPSTDTDDELPYIDDQNVTKYAKEKARAFAEGAAGLDDSATRRFVNRFRKLFIRFLYPTTEHIWYEGEEE